MAIKQSKMTQKVKAASASKNGARFAPGSRPGVITRSGNTVFKNGKLMGNYNTKAAADSAMSSFTSPNKTGRITNIVGDRGGQTTRQLYMVDKGTQTGLANTPGIKKALNSRGFTGTYDNRGVIRATTQINPKPKMNRKRTQSRLINPGKIWL